MSASHGFDPRVLTARELKVVRAIGQTLFPRDRNIDVDAVDVNVAAYIDDWLARCGTLERTQFHALCQAFDAGFAVWARNPAARIEAAPQEERRAYLDSWERSTTYVQRQLWEGLRGMFLFAFVDAEQVRDAIGMNSDDTTAPVEPLYAADVHAGPVGAEPARAAGQSGYFTAQER